MMKPVIEQEVKLRISSCPLEKRRVVEVVDKEGMTLVTFGVHPDTVHMNMRAVDITTRMIALIKRTWKGGSNKSKKKGSGSSVPRQKGKASSGCRSLKKSKEQERSSCTQANRRVKPKRKKRRLKS
jgi:hypothetical protein